MKKKKKQERKLVKKTIFIREDQESALKHIKADSGLKEYEIVIEALDIAIPKLKKKHGKGIQPES